MKRCWAVLVASVVLVLAAGVGNAWAGDLGGLPGGQTQTITQSQTATNSIDQTANAGSAAINASPNVAVANVGSVDQNSGASSNATARNTNSSSQSNTENNGARETQSGTEKTNGDHCCASTSAKQDPRQSQSVEQSQDATNSIDQSATAKSAAVNASPNVAIANFGGSCGKCGEGGVTQNSGASSDATASNWNASSQSNTLKNSAGQSQTGAGKDDWKCCHAEGKSGGQSQKVDQSQDASNSISQDARAWSVAVNASPNVAIANFGDVNQNSGASSDATASNWNASSQSNTLKNSAGQSQTGAEKGDGKCCRKDARSGRQSQETDQSQDASNSITQEAKAWSFALNASPNVAVLNLGRCGKCGGGGVTQNSGASSKATATNTNHSSQSNTLNQTARQRQSAGQQGGCCDDGCRPSRCSPCHPSRCDEKCGGKRQCKSHKPDCKSHVRDCD